MPRRPKKDHPLRRFRTSLKMSQSTLGEELNVTAQTIKKIEHGDQELTDAQQIRLLNLYGVMPQSLLSTASEPMDVFGRTFAEASFHDWTTKQGYDWISDGHADQVLGWNFKYITALFRAAARKRRFMALKFGLDSWIKTTVQELRLDKDFSDQLVRMTSRKLKRTYTVGEVLGSV